MTLKRTQSVKLSVASTYLTIKDTTDIEDYNENGILDPVNEVQSISYTLYDEYEKEIYTKDITSDSFALRSDDGLKLEVPGLSDDIFVSKLVYVFDSTEYPSITKDCFYSLIKNNTSLKCLTSNWKDSTSPKSLMSYSKYTVYIKSILDNIKAASDNNLYEEFKIFYNKLKGVL